MKHLVKNSFFRSISAIVIILSMVILPLESFAAAKKSSKTHYSKHSVKSVKHSRTRVSSKVSSKKSRFQKASYSKKRALKARKMQLAYVAPAMPLQEYDGSGPLNLSSSKVLVINQTTGETIYAKNTNIASPIASITKLMTAMVMLDAKLPLSQALSITEEDLDYLKGTGSRLSLGTTLSRGDMLQLALMASENRAAAALGRNYPGGSYAFVKAMNAKALSLGLVDTEFTDPTGLDSGNISTAEDLVRMVNAAHQYPEIRAASTSASHEVYLNNGYLATFKNTNGLVREGEWDIGLSKTGFISEAGRCLVMQANINGDDMIIVLLDSNGKYSRIGDANRIRKWVEYNVAPQPATTTGHTELKLTDKLS